MDRLLDVTVTVTAELGRVTLPISAVRYANSENALAFAKLKALLRKEGKRTVEGLWEFLGQALDAFAPAECRNYFRHCGYNATPTSKAL